MNHETPENKNERDWKFTKRAKRLAATALTTIITGAAVIGVHEITKDNPEDAFFAEATVPVQSSEEFGGSDEGWGQGTAERAIKNAVEKGIEQIEIKSTEFDNIDVSKVIEDLPVHDQAAEALDTAGYGKVLPESGDELVIEVAVTADSTGAVSYEVTDAKINDFVNNQE